MFKKVLLPGLLGGFVLILWTIIVNGILGFKSSMDMKHIPNENQVYEILKENITEPGRYISNPQIVDNRFPENEPVFGVIYGGIGHEAAGWIMLIQLPLIFLAPIVATFMLSITSKKILESYFRKVLFFTGIGLLVALFTDLMDFGIGNYPLKDAFIYAIYNIITWTVIGLVVAWRMKPAPNISTE